jgi:hypothetical protein
MLNELSDLWARLRVHWHAVAVAVVAAAPCHASPAAGGRRPAADPLARAPRNYVDLIVTLLPFVLAIMKPMIHLEDPKDLDE